MKIEIDNNSECRHRSHIRATWETIRGVIFWLGWFYLIMIWQLDRIYLVWATIRQKVSLLINFVSFQTIPRRFTRMCLKFYTWYTRNRDFNSHSSPQMFASPWLQSLSGPTTSAQQNSKQSLQTWTLNNFIIRHLWFKNLRIISKQKSKTSLFGGHCYLKGWSEAHVIWF